MHLSGPGSQFTLVDLTNLYLCHSTFIFIVFFSFVCHYSYYVACTLLS